MTHFIKLNQFFFQRPDGTRETDTVRWVASKHIATMKRVDAGLDQYTELITSVGQLLVQETPEEISKMMGDK